MRSRQRNNSFWAIGLLALLPVLASGQQPKEIRLTADEFSFHPAKVEVPRGEFKLTVTNRGHFPHGLAIVGRDEKIGYIDSGDTRSLVVRLDQEGNLVFYCPQPGHRGKGMEGRLAVKKK